MKTPDLSFFSSIRRFVAFVIAHAATEPVEPRFASETTAARVLNLDQL